MKNISLLVTMLLFNSSLILSQVAINANGSQADNSAGLDVNFTDKGFLPPRLTQDQISAI